MGVKITSERWLEAIAHQLGTNVAYEAAHASDKKWADLNAIAAWAKAQHDGPGIFVPIYTKNCANNREHYWWVSSRAKECREAVYDACTVARVAIAFPVRVVMTRLGPRKMDAGCGLNTALKPVRDGVAEYFGVDDGREDLYKWVYEQDKSPRGCHGVRIELFYGEEAVR